MLLSLVEGGGVKEAEGRSKCLIINGTQNYNSLILVIRHKLDFPLHVYSAVVIKMKLYCLSFAYDSR